MKIIRILSKVIVLIALLNIYTFSVRHIVVGGERFGILTSSFKYFIEFPNVLKNILNELSKNTPYQVIVDENFKELNLLEKDVFALNARFLKNTYVYELSNLKNDSVLHYWTFPKDKFVGSYERFLVAHPQNPILLDDGSIIGMLYGTKNLFRLDKSSNMIWHNTSKVFHHSLNMSHDNHIWACTKRKTQTRNEHSNNSTFFIDDVLTKINAQTGSIVFEKSLSDLLISNGYISLVHGYTNGDNSNASDLFHLNDIQPINNDGEFWKKGDLLLSLRHRSMIIHYRPESNKILRIISGPFLAQHDVDIISENKISIFNNNRTGTKGETRSKEEINDYKATKLSLKSSNIVVYNFADTTFTTPSLHVFEKEKIYTSIQGTHTFLENGDLFIESTQSGKIYILRNNKVILKKYANRKNDKGTTEYPHWMRIYENINFLK